MTYLAGSRNAWSICDRCGEKKRRYAVGKEWTGLMVCTATCLDPVPPELTPPNVYPEGVPLPNARPRPTDVFASTGPIDTSGL